MTKAQIVSRVLSLSLAASVLVSQAPVSRVTVPKEKAAQVRVVTIDPAQVPKSHLRTSEYFNNAVMQSFGRAPTQLSFRMGKEEVVAGKGYKDTEATIKFGSTFHRAELRGQFLGAVCHNVELSPVWSLRRVRLQEGKKAGTWSVGNVVFASRRSDAEGRPFVRLAKAAGKLRAALRLLENTCKGVRCVELALDFSKERPVFTVAIEVVGDDYKKRFLAFETAVSEANKAANKKAKTAAKPVFRDVRWRGDESPLAGKAGARFHLDFVLDKAKK